MKKEIIEPSQDNAVQTVLEECVAKLLSGDFPVYELRPKPFTAQDAVEGDYDYLVEKRDFRNIVQLFFDSASRNGVSLLLKQEKPFLRQIIILNNGEPLITFSFRHRTVLKTSGKFFSRQRSLNYKSLVKAEKKKTSPASSLAAYFICSLERLRLIMRSNLRSRITPCAGPDGSGKTYFMKLIKKTEKYKSSRVETVKFKRYFRKTYFYTAVFWSSKTVLKISRLLKGLWISRTEKRRFHRLLLDAFCYFYFLLYYKIRGRPHNFTEKYPEVHWAYGTYSGLPRSIIDERLRGAVFFTALVRFWITVLMPAGKKTVFTDRYFLEFMIRGYKDYKLNKTKPMAGYSILLHLIPVPRRLVILAADPEIIIQRKKQLSVESMKDIYSRYLSFAVDHNIHKVYILNSNVKVGVPRGLV